MNLLCGTWVEPKLSLFSISGNKEPFCVLSWPPTILNIQYIWTRLKLTAICCFPNKKKLIIVRQGVGIIEQQASCTWMFVSNRILGWPDAFDHPLLPASLSGSWNMATLRFGQHLIKASAVILQTELSFALVNRKPVVPGRIFFWIII